MRKKYSVVNGFSVKKTEPATLAPRATSKSSSSGGDKNSSRSNSSSGNNPNINNDNYDSSSNEQDKKKSIPVETNPTKKQKGQQQQRHRNIAREKNERGGFKSTEERKLAQLIPVLDEDGIIIEDHFISPRDTDGDGIPDSYVLLRPAPSSEYMADIGLFDDDIAPPIPAVPSLATITAPAATTTTTGTNSEASIMGTISVAEANSLASATAFVPL
ncbi:hypothetical protein BCR41DRAFT_367047 [Lobosporangium transversale]|uniref:Uncharacterized protein n=1 Tax=Lobosporangium transversale TaxID=64571 RepID=A0A1Y2H346_9FUNG|nr:hypothetical protein BCR41DRAFT_367047 [Lobosporangium transversale]ORZ28411.1 hypothetical protein BCR41DRAFT_367047 [Lobosporangium transversale]|eukprot:XP_021886096.1 hypothetical protein BCR41DRAFT_367047 [Lobosporangium transversale]